MKRMICLLLALALCLTAFGGALAQCTLTLEGSVNGAEFLRDSNLLRVRTQNGYGLITMQGDALTETMFADVEIQEGYIVAANMENGLNTYGALDAQGNAIMPFEYGDIEFLSPEWALGYKLVEATSDHYDYTSWGSEDAYYLIDTVDVYSVAGGKCVATLPRANFKDADTVGTRINIEDRSSGVVTTYDRDFKALGTVTYTFDDTYADVELVTFRENGQYGLRDASGQVVMEPSFYSVYDFEGDYALVSTGEKEGLIDKRGQVIIPAEYEDVKRSYYLPYDEQEGTSGYAAGGYFGVVLDGKLGFAMAQGVVTCEPKLSEKVMDFNGASATYTDMEDKLHILAADGVDTVVDGYQSMYCADYSAGRLYRVTDEDYNYGLLDWHGNVLLPCAYDGFSFSADGRYLLADVSYEESELYRIDYSKTGAQAVRETAQAEEPAVHSAADIKAATGLGAAQKEDAAQTETSAADTDAVSALLDSACALLDSDPASAAPLLQSAVTLLGADHQATALLQGAATLLETDAAVNAASAKALVETAAKML